MHVNESNDSQPADAAGVRATAIDVHNHSMPLPLLNGSRVPACRTWPESGTASSCSILR